MTKKQVSKQDQTIDEKSIVKEDVSKNVESKQPNPSDREKKKQNFIVRAIWTIVMFLGFITVLSLGHLWMVLLIFVFQILVFKECIAVASKSSQEKNLPLTKSLNWYFLFTTIYYLDGESFIHSFNHLIFTNKILTPLATHHKFLSYFFYIFGFVFFVITLQKGHYKFQFSQLCITHMVLLLVVFQAHLIINNIFNGMIWFLLPVLLVITNDIFAYLCGITFGKTQLIAISPKKTVEGFVGAWIFTSIVGILLAKLLTNYDYLICPVTDLRENIFSHVSCERNPIFVAQDFRIPPIISENIGFTTLTIRPIYFHSLNLASFASLIAPFGGFFASGLKRTFNAKDFGHTIPGHGGITDRIDCQFLMGSFAYLYYETFLSTNRINVGSILQMIVTNMEPKDIIQLIDKLHLYLFNTGIIDEATYNSLAKLI
ncbi:Phosphatidate cytidylyltransferase [Wickerhamomyces ciferrii]|uniref:Phosphatidate cytidylyltransferase n=1 Tax=Wickerhamomyces ciferrii (strain ATCC 14091 / BCRC 22168 / CBS 111 / JCM 3599 / NBRC 0793 / NRRL Y-1031 F-60-10) TaxID=1206466 RepID=K0KI86_WICCF|nr:Phosphatidate cytidylyltransferase [Wickerhamomyces ciferrii]CCH44925.1 Phosphatidate cytidylyltransferase [Wickerhamomyces ciferrii]